MENQRDHPKIYARFYLNLFSHTFLIALRLTAGYIRAVKVATLVSTCLCN